MHIATIESKVGNAYQSAISAEIHAIEAGKADPETRAFLSSLGVDAARPGALQTPEVQAIIHSRAATKVYLSSEAQTDIALRPDLRSAAEGLSGLRSRLGLMSTVPASQVTQLLADQPRAVRERATEITEAVTTGNANARVSRTGNVLHIHEGEGGAVSHEIELSAPPVIVKRMGVLEARRQANQTPSNSFHASHERNARVLGQIHRYVDELDADAAVVLTWPKPPGELVPPQLDVNGLTGSINSIKTVASNMPASVGELRRHLATLNATVTEARAAADAWISAKGSLPYPDDLVEESHRREAIEEPMRHLARMAEAVAAITAETQQLIASSPATSTEVGQAALSFDEVATDNLKLLQSLGFDRWDSMDDVNVFLDYAQGLAAKQMGLTFPPDFQSGGVALGERPFGREATVLVDELYRWLPGHRELDYAGRYRAIRADLALGPDSELMRVYRRMKVENDGAFPSAGQMRIRNGDERSV